MYIPVCERPKIAQVCKNWNRVVHSYCFKVKKLELSHWEYDCPQNFLEQFKTNENKSSFLRSLLDKCCSYLTELDLVAYDSSNIVPIVNESCPNLVKLRLRLRHPFDNKDFKNAFSRMSKLKILKIIFQRTPKIPKTLILSLKNVANTLNELTLFNKSEGTMTWSQFPNSFLAIIPKLKALKKIEIGGIGISCRIANAIVDAKLNFHHHEYICKDYLDIKLVDITHLFLSDIDKLTDDVLYIIANSMKFVNHLSGNSSLVTDIGIQAITKMKHLKHLYLPGKSNITDSSLKLIKGLQRLVLPGSYKITNNTIEEILENSPSIYVMRFEHTSITPEFIEAAKKVSNERKILLKLLVQFPNHCVSQIKTEYLHVWCLCCVKYPIRL
ncbi:uncharacterized protein LOC122854083 [Aphidius gifuensis]|uniref:uncharacterized protein LOC122854083 n=1 Tax=Aphidius gifuensis TaxID=684658 RepID=UPI001CDCB3B4|nr:uncharacterized protein LOC122854083 [Aphidius gifuensis]